MTESRSSFDSESNFSLVEHGSSRVGRPSPLGPGHGTASNGRVNSYSISTIMNAATAGPYLATTLNNLNPLRPTGPKTGATRGKPAAPIVLSDLPKVSRSEFAPYVDSIKEDYAIWSKLQTAILETPILDDLHESVGDLDDEQFKRRQAVKDALDSSNLDPITRAKRELPSLKAIPDIFFEESFSLANPHTFDDVTGGAIVGREGQSSDTGQSFAGGEMDQILQERLTHYLDVVEVHLSVEIRVRSASFFSALSNLQALNTQSAEALRQIALLKNMLQEVDESVARKGLARIRHCKRRQRLNSIDHAIERVKEVLRAVQQAEELGEAGEIQGALDLADELEREWNSQGDVSQAEEKPKLAIQRTNKLESIGEDDEEGAPLQPASSARQFRSNGRMSQHPPVRISRIAALSRLPTRLAKLRQYLAHALETEFVAVVTHDARENLAAYIAADGHWKLADEGSSSLQELAEKTLRERVSTILAGVTRCGHAATNSAISAWRNAALGEVRRVLREQLPHATRLLADEDEHTGDSLPSSRSSIDGERSQPEGSTSALSAIRGMSPELYVETARQLHALMLGCIHIADTQAHTILDIIITAQSAADQSALGGTGSSASVPADTAVETGKSALQTELQDGIQAVADLANIRLARIFTSRAEIHAALPLEDFVAVFNEGWQFVLNCEVVCKKMIVGLRGVLVAQAKSFLQMFHQRHVSEAATLVEKEQWSPVDVPASVQRIVDRFVESAVSNPKSWDLSLLDPNTEQGEDGKSAKHLEIEDKTYFAVGAGLKLIQFLEEYLQVVVNLPLLTTDAMARIIELLKQFNSRVCQVVLGAGAMRSAGLKNITAKHLALASQSLSIMINLIPYIRECLRRHLRAKQAVILVEFDKLKRDYQEHQYEIHAKLVAIMGDRLAVHCAALQEIDWEAERDVKAGPNGYMQTLVKETATLHKVLYKYLPGSALETVMLQVLSAINSRLAEEYGKITAKSDAAKERILEDARFMKGKFSELKGLERDIPGAGLEDLIRMKKVEKPAPAIAQKQFTTPSLTRSRGSISQHKRTPSSASLLKAEQPSTISSEATTPDLASATEKSEPLDIKTDISPEQPSSAIVEAAAATSAAIETRAEEVAPEDVPLPPSPTLEGHEIAEEVSMPPVPPIADSVAVLAKPEDAPATPTKDPEPRNPPVPEKTVSPAPPSSKSPPPASNVKNRLAGLFSKRPTTSLPKVELPKVSIPQLSNIGIPNLRADRMFSPDRQQGSPAQARSSLDLPRAKALLEKQDAAANMEDTIPEYDEVPLTAADAMEASAEMRQTKANSEEPPKPSDESDLPSVAQDTAGGEAARTAEPQIEGRDVAPEKAARPSQAATAETADVSAVAPADDSQADAKRQAVTELAGSEAGMSSEAETTDHPASTAQAGANLQEVASDGEEANDHHSNSASPSELTKATEREIQAEPEQVKAEEAPEAGQPDSPATTIHAVAEPDESQSAANKAPTAVAADEESNDAGQAEQSVDDLDGVD